MERLSRLKIAISKYQLFGWIILLFYVFVVFNVCKFVYFLPLSNNTVALKIIKNVDKYREAAKFEIKVLKTIAERDPSCRK